MKKVFALLVAMTLVLSLAACGKDAGSAGDGGDRLTAAEKKQDTADAGKQGTADAGKQETAGKTEAEKEPVIPGVLYQIDQKEGEEPLIRAVSLDGNQAGIDDDDSVNGLEPSVDKIRFIFMLQEWISITLDSDKTSGLTAYIIKHQEDPETYIDSFASLLDDAPMVELNKPADDDSWGYWGEMYLSEDYPTGYYDLVFANGLKPVAKVTLKFFGSDELTPKSNDELWNMMKNEAKPIAGGE